tara:strand:- start:7275 stop:8480 length:1206 start_codon:yes stop_codon:yes gene_type:complete
MNRCEDAVEEIDNDKFENLVDEIRKHLDSSRQNWLVGAGISCNSKIPLMQSLTKRIYDIINEDSTPPEQREIYKSLSENLPSTAHVEHYLSHLGDLIALAQRAKDNKATINNKSYSGDELRALHCSIVKAIGNTVRYGYADEEVGDLSKPIVEVKHHVKFISALFKNRENLLDRSQLNFFTTNYDTLLEDALSLSRYKVVDGFSGGAVGFWSPKHEFYSENNSNAIFLYKLHGSIDWHHHKDYGLVRVRYGTKYLADLDDIMIYPQATKYIETQRNPFAILFDGLRNVLSKEENVLLTCGYSFGDEHINSEIELALQDENNKTTVIAFIKENTDDDDGVSVNTTLDKWLNNPIFGKRIYVAGEKGIYYNSTQVIPAPKDPLTLWMFSGLTDFLSTGVISND